MPFLVLYLVKCSIALSVAWIFYQVFLRKLTFYTVNRWYLLFYSLLSFFIPFIDIGSIVEKDPAHWPLVIQYIPSIGHYTGAAAPGTIRAYSLDHWTLLLALVILGSVLPAIRLVFRWLSLRRILKKGRLIANDGLKIYQVDENIIPFSFGNAIYINRHLHTEKEWEEIILHEYVHIRQKHTADILLAEILCILNWYNPFSWLIRSSIRQNLEFIADDKVLRKGLDKKSYQYHLLKVVGESRYRLANNFNFSSLKKRIIMMNKVKSARLQLVKFLFVLPLIGVLLVAFRNNYEGIFKPVKNDPVRMSIKKPRGLIRTGTQGLTLKDTVPVKTYYPIAHVKLSDTGGFKLLFVVDGVPVKDSVPNLNPNEISRMAILKNSSAIAIYGPGAKGGVVLITTKKQAKLDSAAGSHITITHALTDPQ